MLIFFAINVSKFELNRGFESIIKTDNMKNLFFIDFETTGLNPYHDEPIEIGIQKYGAPADAFYNTLIIPTENGVHYKYVPPRIVEITGITDKQITQSGISHDDAIFNTFKYIEENSEDGPIYIIAHNGLSFDFIFFRKMIHLYSNRDGGAAAGTRSKSIKETTTQRIKYLDTVLLARYLLPNERVNQPSLCKKYNIKNTDEHRSMGDVLSLMKIYKIICEQLSYTKGHPNKNHYLENTNKVIEELFI